MLRLFFQWSRPWRNHFLQMALFLHRDCVVCLAGVLFPSVIELAYFYLEVCFVQFALSLVISSFFSIDFPLDILEFCFFAPDSFFKFFLVRFDFVLGKNKFIHLLFFETRGILNLLVFLLLEDDIFLVGWRNLLVVLVKLNLVVFHLKRVIILSWDSLNALVFVTFLGDLS